MRECAYADQCKEHKPECQHKFKQHKCKIVDMHRGNGRMTEEKDNIPWQSIYILRDVVAAEIWRKQELLEKLENNPIDNTTNVSAVVKAMIEDHSKHLAVVNKWLQDKPGLYSYGDNVKL